MTKELITSKFGIMTRQPELMEAALAFMVALSEAFGFPALPPCPARYAEAVGWMEKHSGELTIGAWVREISPPPHEDETMMSVSFVHESLGYLQLSFYLLDEIHLHMDGNGGMFKDVPKAAEVVKNFNYALLTG